MKTFTMLQVGGNMPNCKLFKKKSIISFCLLIAVILISFSTLQAQPPSHDPSSMIQNTDGRYWIFTTGTGIWCMSSATNTFSSWQAEATPFGSSYPSWVKNYVSGFTGFFWAPDIIKYGSKYLLYYSCAGTGAPAAIGVCTATNLKGPWTDYGMVKAGNNAIDPSLLIDGSKIWMAWGNWQAGIDVVQISTSTAKPTGSTTHLVSGSVEGPCLIKNGSYYYLFYQRGLCCNGVNSTYYVVVARSTSVTGPYSGERTFLPNKSGRIIGPGHIGYGCGKLTYHFYDGNANGAAKLAITTLSFSNGWPVAGTYKSADGEVLDGFESEGTIDVFPNPSDGNFTIKGLNTESNIAIKIMDMQGRQIYCTNSNQSDKVDIKANLAKGTYILRVENANAPFIKKLVIE